MESLFIVTNNGKKWQNLLLVKEIVILRPQTLIIPLKVRDVLNTLASFVWCLSTLDAQQVGLSETGVGVGPARPRGKGGRRGRERAVSIKREEETVGQHPRFRRPVS